VKNRLESANSQLKAELGEATRKISSLECDVADVKCTLKQKERQIEKVRRQFSFSTNSLLRLFLGHVEALPRNGP